MQSLYLQRIMKKNAAKDYKKTKPKQTQFPKCQKMNANAFSQKDYENETAFRPKKTNPNKPNFKRDSKGYYLFVRVQRIQRFIIRRLPIRSSLYVFTGYPFIILKEKLQLYFAQSQRICDYRQ